MGIQAQSDSAREHIQTAGDVFQIGLPIAAMITAASKKDKDGLKQLFYGFSTTFVLTHALKQTIRKKRPDPSEAFNAFPSGHTSVAFHSAAFLQKRYGYKYGIPAFVLAGFTGYSRIEGIGRKHDFWDVLGGAVLGSLSAYFFTKPYSAEEGTSFSFSKMNNSYTLSLQYAL